MPELGEAHNRLGTLLLQRGRYSDAVKHLRHAAKLLPWEASPRIHLAQACYYVGCPEEGREALTQAERMGGDPELVARVRQAFFAD